MASLSHPTIGGLALPPKMPTELTQAMPLAKAGPVRNTAGNGNKWAFEAYRPIVASDSPPIVGWFKDATGSFSSGLYALAIFGLFAAIVAALCVRETPVAVTQQPIGATAD